MPSPLENKIVQTAIEYLNGDFGKHRRARWHVDVKREPGKTNVSSTSGRLDSEDEEALAAGLPYIHDFRLGNGLDKIVAESNETSSPFATAGFTFEREGKNGWKHEGFVHSVADREALEAERAELDEGLHIAMGELKRDGWKRIALSYQWNKPMRVVCMVGTKPEPLSSETLDSLIANYQKFFAERGLGLDYLKAEVVPKKKNAFSIDIGYGVPRVG